MSLKIGGSHSSSSSSTNSNSSSNTNSNSTLNSNTSNAFNSATTPTVPDWASSLTQNIAGRVGDVSQLDPQSLVAGANPLQTHAATTAGGLSGLPWNFDTAASLTRGAADTSWLTPYLDANTPFASGGKASQWVDNYMNPYQQQVVDATSADLDASDGRTRAQQALDLAGSGAFGGSGAALTQSMTEGELARARASALGGLRSQGYQTALSAAAGDADRATQARIANAQLALQDRGQKAGLGFQAQQQQLQAGNQLAGLSSAYDANQRANIGVQDQVGQDLRNVDQQQLQAPVTNTQQIVAMLSGLPIQLFTGQTQAGTQTGSTDSTGSSSSSGTTVGSSSSKGQNTNVSAEANFNPPMFSSWAP